MIEQIKELSFDKLRELHREIAALIAQRRHETLKELRSKAALLGFTASDLAPQKNTKSSFKYKDNNGNTWTGRGRKPQWVRELIDAGEDIERYRV